MNLPVKQHLATVVAIAFGTGLVHVGDSGQKQADSDTDIVGNLLGQAPIVFSATGTLISGAATVTFAADGAIQEVAFIDADGLLIDRFIITQTSVRAGGQLSFTWSMEVL